MPTRNLPRYSIGLTLSTEQVERLDEIIEKYNATARADTPKIMSQEEAFMTGMVALEVVTFNITDRSHVSVFEQKS